DRELHPARLQRAAELSGDGVGDGAAHVDRVALRVAVTVDRGERRRALDIAEGEYAALAKLVERLGRRRPGEHGSKKEGEGSHRAIITPAPSVGNWTKVQWHAPGGLPIVPACAEALPCCSSPRVRPLRNGRKKARRRKAPRPTCSSARIRRRSRRARRAWSACPQGRAAKERRRSTPWPSAKAIACRRTSASSPTACAGRAITTSENFSLVLGGPLYQLLRR